jgi:uncharacterized small protein (DUF1192 family)
MMASHNMLIDGGLASGNPKMASVTPQASVNEVDILLDIYANQLYELDRLGYSDDVKLRLVDELDKKLYALESKAQRLDAERQNRRRGGLFRNFARALGRATGWVVSKAMDATGKIVQYSIEEVGPQLLKDAVFSGTPLTGAAFRAKFREMIRNRVRAVVNRKIETRLAALASEPEPDFYSTNPNSESTPLPASTKSAPTSTSPPMAQNQPDPQPTIIVPESVEESSLTPEEEANAGTHTYLSTCYGPDWCEDAANIETLTITFSDESVDIGGQFFSKVDRNQYSWTNVDGYVWKLTFSMDGFEYYVAQEAAGFVFTLQP